ncbi:MAG TPA: serine/threonine-protein kinase [Polyangiaceae bacterium]|nr:serine/threonine-protein kinase [Polyangiaceae bacterium]
MRKYRLIAELGHGGMADVFLAVAPGPAGFNKLVVIKQLRPSLVEDEEFLTMFLDEARLAARLNHPNVIHTYEVGQDEALPYLAMEYLDGQPLHRVLQKTGRDKGLPLEAHLRILCDGLVGLHYAHELRDYDGTPLGVVHRDVTPQNIFITYEGAIKVVDFGIAKALNQTAETRTGVIKGKIAYMSPEQARSEDIDRRSDLFAMGVMLWEAATGRRLWKGMSDVTVLQRLVSGAPLPSPRSINPEVPEWLERICLKALAFARDDRYATAAEMHADLESFLDQAPVRVGSREVGRLISERFTKEREVMQATIDQQIKGVLKDGWTTGTFALAKLDSPLGRTHFGAGSPGNEETPASGQHFRASSSGSQSSFITGAAAVAPVAPAPPSSRASRGLRGAVVGGLLVASVGLGWAMVAGRAGGGAASDAHGGRPGLDLRAPAEVTLSVRALPPTAQLFLDDERLEGNPYRGKRPRSSEVHRLRAEAPGYAPQVREIGLGSDLTIELSLDHEPAAAESKATARATPPRWAPPPKAPPKAAPPPSKIKPSVTLDTDNPW